MTWFKNLRTMTKLMLGFGIMALLLAGVGYQGVSGMGTIDGLMATMYERHMLGLSAIKDINTGIASIGRQARGIILETDQTAMEENKVKVDALWAQVDQAMLRCDQTFITEQGKANIANLKEVLPQYRSVVYDIVRLAMNKDKAAAIAAMKATAVTTIFERVGALSRVASDLKEVSAKRQFEASKAVYEQSRFYMLAMMLGAVVFALGLGYFIANLLSKQLNQTVEVLETVSSGDLTSELDIHTKEEVGRMANAVNTAVTSMREALLEVRRSSQTLASSSEQLASSSVELSSGAQEQAASLEETSASLEEITSSVKQNADSARQANQLASAARETAEKGGHVVSSAVAAMGEINTSSKKIADIITAIDEIAFQTNLLALNAAVEAARAGEQGRGFAVVAAEVRTLAQRSASAAKEIKALIQDSVRKVEAGSQMVNQSGEVLVEIVASVKRVTDIVGEIAAASREQSAGIEQVGQAMSQMDQVTQQNAAQTEELSSTAQSLSSGAEQLQALVERFVLDKERGGRTGMAKPKAVKSVPVKSTAASRSLRSLSRNVAGRDSAPAVTAGKNGDEGGFMDF